MHTSEILAAGDFAYAVGETSARFDAVFPAYHPQDRVGIVAPVYEDGLAHCAASVLALTTRFYDHQRVTARDFFTYPQHFCVLAWDDQGVKTRASRIHVERDAVGEPWCKLDVWPGNRWIAAGDRPGDLLKAVFDNQINRVFWPAGVWPSADDGAILPAFARDILASDLKQVVLYGSDRPDITVTAGEAPAKLVATAKSHAPVAIPDDASPRGRCESFQNIAITDFLAAMAPVFSS